MELQATDFTSNIENVDEVTRKISISIPLNLINRGVDEELNKLLPKLNLKGFRPGKAPRHIVEKTHGERVRAEVTYSLMNNSIREVIKAHKIETVGSPVVDFNNFEKDKDLAFTAQVSLFPQPTINNFEKVKVKVARTVVNDAQVEDHIKRLRTSKAKVKKLEGRDTCQEGDVIQGSLWVRLADKAEDGAPEPVNVPLGEGRLPKDVEAALLGKKVGDTVEVQLKDTESAAEGPGGAAKVTGYKFTLQDISARELPELNDEFAQLFPDYDAKTLTELNTKVRESLQKDAEEKTNSEIQVAILDRLIEENPFQVPQIMVDEEVVGMARRVGLVKPDQQEVTEELMAKLRPLLDEVSRKRVKSSIIVDRVAVQKELKASQEEIDAAVKERAGMYGIDEQTAREYFLSKDNALGFLVEVTRTKVLRWLVDNAEVELE